MSRLRLAAIASLGTALALLAGCGGSISPTTDAWERSYCPPVVFPNRSHDGLMSASDGLGRAVFAPTDVPARAPTSTFANVPNE